MLINPLFALIWLFEALAAASVCGAIIRTKLLKVWPSLFAMMADEVISYLVLNSTTHNYAIYYHLYWANVVLSALLHLWLAYDVARALPAGTLFPMRLRIWILSLAAIVGALSWWALNRSVPGQSFVTVCLIANRAVAFTWLAAFLVCLLGTFASGFAFDITGMRVISGALIRLASWTTLAEIYVFSHSRPFRAAANELDTFLGGCVACYWTYSILLQKTETERETASYFRIVAPKLPSEKEG